MEGKITDAEQALDEARAVAEEAEQGDMLAFIDMVDDMAHTDEDGHADLDGLMEATLPFHEDDRALAALLGFTAGAAIEHKYTE
jgi:hypothetical protein